MSLKLKEKIVEYYSNKIIDFGPTAKGVDWNGELSQVMRFTQLAKVFDSKSNFSVLDYGCGFGAFVNFLKNNDYEKWNYLGYDFSEEMISQGKKLFFNEDTKFVTKEEEIVPMDYVVASGVFNVKLNHSDETWLEYVKDTLFNINRLSIKGFSFNILTSFSDEEFKKDYLYYANPMDFFEFCKTNFSRNVALLHDYELYEFTLIVKK